MEAVVAGSDATVHDPRAAAREARAEHYFEHDLAGQRGWYGEDAARFKTRAQLLEVAVVAAGAGTTFLQVFGGAPWVAVATALLGVLVALAEGEALSPEFLASLRTPERRARDVMAAPAITVDEDTDLGEVARLLTEHRIKRVPVVRAEDGRVIGIVSRADLVRFMASEYRQSAQAAAGGAPRHGFLADMIADLRRRKEGNHV